MNKFLKLIIGFIFLLIIFFASGCYILGNKLPETISNEKANILSKKMTNAVNLQAWNKIKWIEWTFANRNSYLWNKENNFAIVKMGKKNKVLLDVAKKTGVAYINSKEVNGDKANKLVESAYANFCNDSWWLNPIIKVNDVGSNLSTTNNNNELLVNYNEGGVTPGDKYLWKLSENGLPENYKMWVKILPIKGLEVSFTDWVTLENGAKIATSHIIKGINYNIKITDLKTGDSFKDFDFESNPFNMLSNKKNINTTQPK